MRYVTFCLTLILALNFAGLSNANISYVESIDGDLSGPDTPTDLGVADTGLNTVTGTLDNTPGLDPDAFSFIVAAGQQLNSLSFSSLDDGSPHFFAFNNGPVDQVDGSGNLFAGLFGSEVVGLNILDGSVPNLLGSGLPGGPLGSGTYHAWFQETDGSTVNYSIDISISQVVPEPGSASLLMLFASTLLVRSRKRT